MSDLISYDDARARILAAATPLDVERHLLASAAGHYLAEPLISRLTQPPFDASAMDGYAVSCSEVVDGVPLKVIGRSEAGSGFSGTIGPGEVVRIFTGAPIPAGADAVIIQEMAQCDGDLVRFSALPEPGQNIRLCGNDFSAGRTVLEKGARLTPAMLSLAAASGHAELPVFRRPRIALITTGDELVPPGTMPGPDQIVASIGAGLTSLLAPHADRISDHGIVGDDAEQMRHALCKARDSDADVIVTTGGASVGDKDLIRPVLAALGISPDLWRIAVKPGKPLLFAHFEKKLIFGLPGNPVSALTTASILLVPALLALAGAADPGPHFLTLPLAAPLGPNGPRRNFRRARLVEGETSMCVAPIAETDSAHLSSFAKADALIVHSEQSPALAAGTPVKVLLL